jgi:hypothetical protein
MDVTSEPRIEDELECQRLSIDFAQRIDAHEFDRVLELFTEDGVFIRRGTAHSGRPAIRQYLQSRPADEVIRHLCTNSRIRFVSPTEATGLCYVVFYKGTQPPDGTFPIPPSPPGVAEYHDSYVKTGAGWRIRERRAQVIFGQ